MKSYFAADYVCRKRFRCLSGFQSACAAAGRGIAGIMSFVVTTGVANLCTDPQDNEWGNRTRIPILACNYSSRGRRASDSVNQYVDSYSQHEPSVHHRHVVNKRRFSMLLPMDLSIDNSVEKNIAEKRRRQPCSPFSLANTAIMLQGCAVKRSDSLRHISYGIKDLGETSLHFNEQGRPGATKHPDCPR
jgi:hypothetical protein